MKNASAPAPAHPRAPSGHVVGSLKNAVPRVMMAHWSWIALRRMPHLLNKTCLYGSYSAFPHPTIRPAQSARSECGILHAFLQLS